MAKLATQIRLDDMLFNKIKYIAANELRTMNAQMEYYLRRGVDEYEKEQGMISRQMMKSIVNDLEE